MHRCELPRQAAAPGLSVRAQAVRLLLSACGCIIALSLALPARAHFITPQAAGAAPFRGVLQVGGSLEVTVAPSGPWDTCTVLAVVTVDGGGVLSGGGSKTEKHPKFTLTARQAGVAAVTVFFDGQTNDEGFDCPAVVEEAFNVLVVAADSSSSQPEAGSDADPVNTFSGELFMDAPWPDIDLGGPMPLRFQRYYGSYLRRAYVLGDLGSNWRHNFDARLQWNGTRALYTSWRGQVVTFDRIDDTWVQQNLKQIPFQLIADSGADVRLYDPGDDRIYTFDYSRGGAVTGRLIRVEDGHGNAHELAYDDQGRLLTVSDGLGRQLALSYHPLSDDDQIAKIRSVGDGTRLVTFLYRDAVDGQLLTDVIDARGGATVYRYADTSASADHGLLLSWQRPAGNIPYTQRYFGTADGDLSGRVATQTDALGNTTRFAYDRASGLTVVTDPDGSSREHRHDADGRLLAHRDEAGNSIALGYDDDGRRARFADRDGNAVSSSYHAGSGRPATITHEDGSTSSYQYVARSVDGITWYDLAALVFPDGSRESYRYDAVGNRSGMTDRRGGEWSWSYNDRGQVLSEENPEGGITRYSYNDDATLASVTGADGVTATFAYDALRRPVRITAADGGQTLLAYDAHDNLLSYTDALGNTHSFDYDGNDNLIRVTVPDGGTLDYSYDGLDRIASRTDSEGSSTRYSYDRRGRLSEATLPDAGVVNYRHDALGRLTQITDPTGRSWHASYSAAGRLTSWEDPAGNRVVYSYDANGELLERRSPRGFSNRFERDALGRVLRATDPLGQITVIERDAAGLATRVALPGGAVQAAYDHDGNGLMVSATDPTGSRWQRQHDAAGRLLALIDPLGAEHGLAYDEAGRVKREDFAGGLGHVEYSHDLAGRLVGSSYSDGTAFSYRYDGLGRGIGATGISFSYQGSTGRLRDSNGIGITRDSLGRITALRYTPGREVSYDYDGAGRLTRVSDWTGGVTTMSYDGAGRLAVTGRPNGISTRYDYDADGRLVSLREAAADGSTLSSITLTRDGLGRISGADRVVPLAVTAGTDATRTLAFDAAARVAGFGYDAEGRVLQDDARSYRWNLADQLLSISGDAGSHILEYDALGALTSQADEDDARSFVWNYALALPSIAIERSGGSDRHYYVHTPEGTLLYRLDYTAEAAATAASRTDYHYDESGNTLFLSDASGAISDRYAYSPYGRLLERDGDDDNPFTWQGRFGAWSGVGGDLYYLRARWYDAGSGRFLSRDPAQLTAPREINPYAYAALDPMQFNDPSGLAPEKAEKPCGCHRCRPPAPGEDVNTVLKGVSTVIAEDPVSSIAATTGTVVGGAVGETVLTVFESGIRLITLGYGSTGYTPGTFARQSWSGVRRIWGYGPSPRPRRGAQAPERAPAEGAAATQRRGPGICELPRPVTESERNRLLRKYAPYLAPADPKTSSPYPAFGEGPAGRGYAPVPLH